MVGPTIGVLALQGAFAAHVAILDSLGATTVEVRRRDQLAGLDGIVLPGGESSTMSMLLDRSGMIDPLGRLLHGGLPVLGTCAGLILLASEIRDGRADQHALGLLDMTVVRNGYGTQVDSFEADLDIDGEAPPFHAVFIRAPVVQRVGPDIEVVASVDDHPVLCRRGVVTVSAFHPELTADDRIHRRWLADGALHSPG